MTEIALFITIVIVTLVTLFCVDDLFIDFFSIIKGLRPKGLNEEELTFMHTAEQKRVAIMIANWHEDEILERMIAGNVGRVDYQNFDIFLGVYPNDLPTLHAAERISQRFSRVHVVVNSKNGPTSKGQMLNEIVSRIRADEINQGIVYDVLMLQDSEDILHNLSLKLVNMAMETNDFVQIPVFSLPTPALDFTRGTYIDEFTESHTKDMLVRSHLRAGVPSAGVGTAMSRLFVAEMLRLQNGVLMKEDTLTEDYHLGMMARRLGYNSEFVCRYRESKTGNDYIATREFFPAQVATSIRQKARWTLGISIQGFNNLKWGDSLVENYFLWRDRRGLLNAPILIMNYALFLALGIFRLTYDHWPRFVVESEFLQTVFVFNFVCLAIRLLQRFRLIGNLNGYQLAMLMPVRWMLANYINTMATFKAVRNYWAATRRGEVPKWQKTTHELPKDFGVEVPASLSTSAMALGPATIQPMPSATVPEIRMSVGATP